jgi:type I restriction enzyme R subunit
MRVGLPSIQSAAGYQGILSRGLGGMKSVNFEFLRPRWQDLAALGAFAEQYAHPDPPSALVKLRSYAEQIVSFIYHQQGLPRAYQPNLNDLLNESAFQQAVPRVVVSKLHALRIHGNKAAHGENSTRNTALWLLKEAYDLGCWLFLAYGAGSKEDCGRYIEPKPGAGDESKEALKREKKAVLEKLAAQEFEMQRLLADLETARSQAAAAQATAEDLQFLLQNGQAAVSVLDLNERQTRYELIDSLLVAAGWQVGPRGHNTPTVHQEVEVDHQPTGSGKGYADYVLWDDQRGRPLAVVEAKKTAIDPEQGRTQAKLYADGLEKMHGQRPIIFYTNGFDIWIWNDAEGETPRKLYGFYSRDSLDYLLFQRTEKLPLVQVGADPGIVDRMYQSEAVRQVLERFTNKHRKALIVQATGTGKTRVAIALSEALGRARWARRILFLSDRRELRRQAERAFKRFMPGEPRTVVTSATSQDRDKRIYLATYPAMMKCFGSFDVGFFDLIIADESHRSIYNRYRDLFLYFDALQIGLTATPVDMVSRNTYQMFECEDQDPTFNYGLEQAIADKYLVPFQVQVLTTFFLREGIKYSRMTAEQRRQLEDGEVEPEQIEYERHEVDKQVFNRDTNRKILRNLMENGIRNATGTRPGKTIVFARSHNHAVLMQNLFYQMYPQYGGNFCRIIDNYDPRSEQLIDDFKGLGRKEDEITIAVSVDMLDTGIDVPEVVNLVFAKPVFSKVKFWQMIGRGTRLSKDLFGPGVNKTHFLIFDHWEVFKFFDEEYKPAEGNQNKSLPQRLFEARVQLAETALDKAAPSAFDLAIGLVRADIADLPSDTIAVREAWKQVKTVEREEVLNQFDAATKAALRQDIAPLMQWRDIAGHEQACKFDLLVGRLQTELLRGASRFDDLKADLLGEVARLQMNLSQVRMKSETIAAVRGQAFWDGVTVEKLEMMRRELRGIMQFQGGGGSPLPPKVIDIEEDDGLIERRPYKVKLEGLELAAYRLRVEKVLHDLFDANPTLQRIKAGQSVSEDDLQALTSLVLTQEPDLDLTDLMEYYPETAGHLDMAIRSIIGLDATAVQARFAEFVRHHPTLNARQIKFLELLQNHISRYGSIEIDRLYEDPFTTLHNDGVDGIFHDDAQIGDLLAIVESFKPLKPGGERRK